MRKISQQQKDAGSAFGGCEKFSKWNMGALSGAQGVFSHVAEPREW
jgi:hypothetical protein